MRNFKAAALSAVFSAAFLSVTGAPARAESKLAYDQVTGWPARIHSTDPRTGEVLISSIFNPELIKRRDPSELVPSVSEYKDLKVRESQVLFYNGDRKTWVTDKPSFLAENGMAMLREQVFYESYSRFHPHMKHESELAREVGSLQGFKAGQEVCVRRDEGALKSGREGEITHVFSNGMAEVEFGDFFGKRFLIFVRPEIVKLENLERCGKSSGEPATAAAQDRRSSDLNRKPGFGVEPSISASGLESAAHQAR